MIQRTNQEGSATKKGGWNFSTAIKHDDYNPNWGPRRFKKASQVQAEARLRLVQAVSAYSRASDVALLAASALQLPNGPSRKAAGYGVAAGAVGAPGGGKPLGQGAQNTAPL